MRLRDLSAAQMFKIPVIAVIAVVPAIVIAEEVGMLVDRFFSNYCNIESKSEIAKKGAKWIGDCCCFAVFSSILSTIVILGAYSIYEPLKKVSYIK